MRGDSKNKAYNEDYKAYRISRAALNMLAVYDAWEYKDNVKVFVYCLGFVITDLAGMQEEKEKADIAKSADESAKDLSAIAERKRDKENWLFLHDEKTGELYPS